MVRQLEPILQQFLLVEFLVQALLSKQWGILFFSKQGGKLFLSKQEGLLFLSKQGGLLFLSIQGILNKFKLGNNEQEPYVQASKIMPFLYYKLQFVYTLIEIFCFSLIFCC